MTLREWIMVIVIAVVVVVIIVAMLEVSVRRRLRGITVPRAVKVPPPPGTMRNVWAATNRNANRGESHTNGEQEP